MDARHSPSKRATVEQALDLDALALVREIPELRAAFRVRAPVEPWLWSWPRRGKRRAAIRCTVETGGVGPTLRLSYQYADERMSYTVALVSTPCTFGGVRWWFVCPEAGCARRCRVLYLTARRFVCRTCAGLVYESQRRPRDRRLERFRRTLAHVVRSAIEQVRVQLGSGCHEPGHTEPPGIGQAEPGGVGFTEPLRIGLY